MSIETNHRDYDEDQDEKTSAHSADIYTGNEDGLSTYMGDLGKTALLNAEEEVDLAKQIEAGMYANHLLQTADENDEQLTADRRLELTIIAQEGSRAKNHLIEANLRLVVFFAKRYQGRGLDLEDTIQSGNIGLIRAVEKFDYTKGWKFSTYAPWWIRQAITRSLADNARTIRIPVYVVESINKVSRIKRELSASLERAPTLEEIAKEADLDVDKVEELLSYKDTISLDTPVGVDENMSLGDLIEDADDLPFEEIVEQSVSQTTINEALKEALTSREYDIIQSRFELNGRKLESHDVIACRLGLSRARIGQIEKKALKKIAKYSDGSLRGMIVSE